MNATETPAYEWNTLDWKRIEKTVFKLQTRIYKASRRGDSKTVHRLQRLMITSRAGKCLAVRKVTQDNRGKKTAGVDGLKSLSPAQRVHLAAILHLGAPAQPARRVWIPKPGTAERRPLGIPTMGESGCSGSGETRTRTRVGGALRAQQLRLPPGTLLP